jgi:IclR family transcriptional regulator, acetate operon repressor
MSVERPMGIVQRSAGLIELLAEEGALPPAEIADRIDTPRPTVYRLSDALGQAGLTEYAPGSRIALSRRWLRLADAARAAMGEWRMARPILDSLAESSGQTVFLSVIRGEQSVCIDWAQGQHNVQLLLRPGRSLPLFAGAEGRVSLAFGVDDVEPYLSSAPFQAYNPRTLVTAAQLRRDVTLSREQGFTLSEEDVTEGVQAIGAPLRTSRTGRFAGALSIAGLTETFVDRRAQLVEALIDAAGDLSATLP